MAVGTALLARDERLALARAFIVHWAAVGQRGGERFEQLLFSRGVSAVRHLLDRAHRRLRLLDERGCRRGRRHANSG